jgi:hypothetical protein
MIRLIIKGNHGQACEAATKHKIVLSAARQHEWQPGYFETIARAEGHYREQVLSWFFESNMLSTPYPIGTLLWYGESNPSSGI